MGTRLTDGVLRDPRVLAGAAAGFACAALSVWAFRGLPLGSLVFWLAPLPVFLAGLSVGPVAAWLAVAVAGGALLPAAGLRGALVYVLAIGLPSALLVSLAMRRGLLLLSAPFALLGIWSAFVAAVSLSLAPAGIGEVMTTQVAASMAGSGLQTDPDTVDALVRAGIALASASLALPLLACGAGAQRFLSRRGLALCPTPAWREARLPGWYIPLPLVALAGAYLLPGFLTTAVLAALLTPLFLRGLAVLHARLRGPLLALFYVAFVVFFIPIAMVAIALGFLDHFGRKPPRS